MPRKPQPPNYRLKLRRGTWQIVWTEQRKPQRISTRTKDHGEALEFFTDFLNGRQAPPPRPTLAQMLDGYLASREGKVIDHERLSLCVNHLKRAFGTTRPEHINKLLIANYTKERQRTVKDGTIRHELLILRAAFKWGTPEWVKVRPTIEVPPAGLPRERWLTRSEAAKLLWGAKAPHMRLFIRLALYTTARTGAILGLTWDRVDFDRRQIDYGDPARPYTSKRRAIVPIGRRLYRALKQAHRIRRTDYVVEYAGKGLKDIAGGFSMACARAGLRNVTPHILRHTGATWMAQAGVDLYKVAGMLGQNPMTTVRVYAKHGPEHLRDAVDALENTRAIGSRSREQG